MTGAFKGKVPQKTLAGGLRIRIQPVVEHLLKERMPASELSALGLLSESLRRIGEYSTDFTGVVLNLTVQKSIEA